MTFLMMWFWRLIGTALVLGVVLGVAMVSKGAGLIPTDAPTKDGSGQFTRKDGYVIGCAHGYSESLGLKARPTDTDGINNFHKIA